MTDTERRQAAKRFARQWDGQGDEKQQTQVFWLDLLRSVFGVDDAERYIDFEVPVRLDHTSFIDGLIRRTRVLIEQKSADVDLGKSARQSDGSLLTPFQQARRYAGYLPHDQNPRWIVVCNFRQFEIHDMNRPNDEPETLALANLEREVHRLRFLVDETDEHIKKEMELSLQAGQIVGVLYDALLEQYNDPSSPETLKSLNALCVRLVFCLYAEDAGIFGRHGMFHDYLRGYAVRDVRGALIELFRILDTPPALRDPYLDEDLLAFPYVNGGLFSDESVIIPRLNQRIVELILRRASEDFDWSSISPTIFGAVFESTLNPETRRSGGMHYTSIENIHKVIDPLFLDGLKAEFAQIEGISVEKTRKARLEAFQQKLAGLTFLDPACGSGNFLTETYLCLRRLENEAIAARQHGQVILGEYDDPIYVSIGQFYGIEINDFAVTVAKTALWIAESQMMKETEAIVHRDLDFLPLKTNAHIVEGNALRLDWESVVPKNELSYIMGNPPFVGFTYMTVQQKEDMQSVFPTAKNLDYVCGWYKIASSYIQGTKIECGFVSTNSITQGETVSSLWRFLNIRINFAYKTFIWDSEAKVKAHVHCVIIGFAGFDHAEKLLFQDGRAKRVQNINAYLCDAPDIIVTSRNKPLCDVSPMVYGNKPADGGNLIIEDADYADFIAREPQAQKFIRPFIGAVEYLHGKKRWCLWLEGASPAEIRQCPLVYKRVLGCKMAREKSVAAAIRKFADTPTLFAQRTQPVGRPYIIIPRVSSEQRRYIPIGFMDKNTIASDAVQLIPDATLYHFGVLTSNIHMAWMRVVCGRLKSDYRYSKDVVYNNFPWPEPTEEQRAKIKQTAQAILDARALYPDASLADLYDEAAMPPELRRAHQANDRAVWDAYGRAWPIGSESACVAHLMKLYRQLAV